MSAAEKTTGKDFVLSTLSTISGTVYKEQENTLFRGENIYIFVYDDKPLTNGNPLDSEYICVNPVDKNTSEYKISGLSGGNYYLLASTQKHADFEDEWWAHPSGTPDYNFAQPISVGSDDAIVGINFYLSHRNALAGDIDRDGSVTLRDAITIMRALTGRYKHLVLVAGDMDNDNRITLSEVMYIVKKLSE